MTRDSRNLLQRRALIGIDYPHYDHSDYLPQKREVLRLYDADLAKLLRGNQGGVDRESKSKEVADL